MTAVRQPLAIKATPLTEFLDAGEYRYEVIDGAVVVSPPTTFSHEDILVDILVALRAAAPPEIAVLGSGYRYFHGDDSFTLGDISAVRRDQAEEEGTRWPPVLVVEVWSRSTGHVDTGRKRDIYAEGGVVNYWLVDPRTRTLTVLALQREEYQQTHRLAGPGSLDLAQPFPVSITL